MVDKYEYLEDEEPLIDIDDSSDIYSDAELEQLREDDEISDFEAGFMDGYNLDET